MNERVLLRLYLIVKFIFAEGKHGNEIRAGSDGQLDEAFAAFEYQAQGMWLGVQGLARASDHDGDGAAHALFVRPSAGEDVLARFAGNRGEAEGEGVVAVERDAKICVEREEGVSNAGEEFGEAEGFCGEGDKGPVRDDTMRVVAEDVFTSWGQFSRPVEPSREVGSKQGP